MLYLGFLKFLKRDKGKEPDFDLENADELDIPPPPPEFGEKDLSGGKGEFPELPEMPETLEDKDITSEVEEKPFPDLEPLPEEPVPELKVRGIGVPKPSVEIPKAPQPARPPFTRKPGPLFEEQKFEEEKPTTEVELENARPKITPYERFERSAVREERAVLEHKEAEGPIYIRVDKFKNILAGTRTIRNNLKIANQSIEKLNEIDVNSEKVLEKWHNAMTDLQKKLIFIDKMLFKKK